MVIKSFNSYKFQIAYTFISLLAIFFRYLIPQNPRLDAVHDDSLMVELAYNILQGEWLGEWNSTRYQALTLFKSPGYAIYLALCMKIGIPPAVGALVIYLIASLLLIKFGFGGNLREKRKLLIYLIFAFNPAFYGNGSSVVYRDILSTAILTLVIAISFYLVNTSKIKRFYPMIGIGYGSLIGFASIIKDDLKYLAIFSFILLTVFIFFRLSINLKFKKEKYSRAKIRYFVIFTVFTSIFYGIITGSIQYLNYTNYGVSLIQDNSHGEFGKLMSNLSGIKAQKTTIDVFVDKNQVEIASQVSETFRKMTPYLESPNMWKEVSCRLYGICDQSSGFFQHELRDGFYISGMANSATEFQSNAAKMNSEILAACNSKEISCFQGIKIPGFGSNYSKINKKYAIDSFFVLSKSIFNWDYITFDNPKTLSKKDSSIHKSWLDVPGVKWNYEYHPITESSLGMSGFIKTLIWIYQIITIIGIFGVLIFGKSILLEVRRNDTFYQFLNLVGLFISGFVLMIFSNVAGWNSFSGAGNYFLIFSPFVIYFLSLVILSIKSVIDKIIESDSLRKMI